MDKLIHGSATKSYPALLLLAPCTEGSLSLLDHDASVTNAKEGILRVCLNGTQGTICDNSWNYKEASVACKALGHSQFGTI